MLVDFGSAKEYIPGGTATIVSRRTPGYAAPEQYVSGTSPRTDVYGLGATLYTLLTGIPPVDALSRTALNWDTGIDPLKRADLLVPAVPVPVAQALQRAMALPSADRFATIEEFWQELTSHTEAQPVQIPRVTSASVLQTPGDTEDIMAITAKLPSTISFYMARNTHIRPGHIAFSPGI